MEVRKPRRPAIIEPETIDYLEGEEDPALSTESAHTSARIFVPAPNGEWSDPNPETKARLLAYLDEHGIEELAELWSSSPAETLSGTLWRLLLLNDWVTNFPQGVATRFKQGLQSANLSQYVDVEGAHSLDFPKWCERLGSLLKGKFTGDFADFLEESQAVLRVLAACEEPGNAAAASVDVAGDGTFKNDALLETAAELFKSASLYRQGRLR